MFDLGTFNALQSNANQIFSILCLYFNIYDIPVYLNMFPIYCLRSFHIFLQNCDFDLEEKEFSLLKDTSRR